MQFSKVFNGEGVISTSQNAFSFQPANGLAYVYKSGVNNSFRVYGSLGSTNYLNITHDNVNGTISTGSGNLVLSSASGNVGIGTSTPVNKLDINGNATASNFRVGGSGVVSVTGLEIATGMVLAHGGDFKVNNSGNNITRINYDDASGNIWLNPSVGNVGIGTTSPTFKFSVGVNNQFVVVPDYAGNNELRSNSVLFGSKGGDLGFFPDVGNVTASMRL